MSHYKLTAIVSSFNSEKYIKGCLEDLTQQSLFQEGGLEIIVVDSNSPQNEAEIIKAFQNSFPHITYIRTAERETLYGAWNTGIKLARGEFLTNANTDDRHSPNAFKVFCETLNKNSSVDLAFSDCLFTEVENETYQNNSSSGDYSFKTFFSPDVCLHFQFGPQPVWRRSLHEKIGYFNPELKAAGDWDFNFRFNLAGCKALHIPEKLGLFLNSASSVSRSDSTSIQEQARIREKYVSNKNVLEFYSNEGWSLESGQQKASALNHFALRAMQFALPWEPTQVFSDCGIAIQAISGAIELAQTSVELVCNLGSILALSGKIQEARQLYSHCPPNSSKVIANINALESNNLRALKLFEQIT